MSIIFLTLNPREKVTIFGFIFSYPEKWPNPLLGRKVHGQRRHKALHVGSNWRVACFDWARG